MPVSNDEVERIKRELLFANGFSIVMPSGFAILPLCVGGSESEPNGRDRAVPYRDALDIAEGEDLVDDVLDCDVVLLMEAPPRDPLDWELHLEACRECAASEGRLETCAHCLEEKVCSRVPIHAPIQFKLSELERALMPSLNYAVLCRPCRNSANKGALEVTE